MAKKINLRRAHGMSKDAAVERMRTLTDALQSKYGVKISHSGDTTRVKGRGTDGSARCTDTEIIIDLKLGLAAGLFAGKIEAGVNSALDKHFG